MLLFVVPALFGHAAIAQDNLLQNYPLRVLAAHQMIGGHLPLYNPLANSGTPLLGGLNAGAFYPLEVLYLFLPSIAAWVINLIAIYATCALGMYSLCRWHGVRSSAAFLAAAAYTYAGTMMGQMVHLAVVQGFALLPWLVLTELVVLRSLLGVGAETPWRRALHDAVPAVVGFAAIWALTFLSGEPRAIAEVELVSLVVVVVELVLHTGVARATWRGRLLVLGANALGLLWGAAIALAQLLPGWAFISQSERANEGYAFFGSGSLVVRWSALLLNPDLFGGNGSLGTKSYFTNYNLAEVTGYATLLGLCAVVALVVLALSRRTRTGLRPMVVYAVLLIVGLFATWGYYTPIGHLFHWLPLFGKTRLPSRNLVVVDLGVAVILGWWLDRVFTHRFDDAALTGRRRWAVAAPAGVAGALTIAVMIWPVQIERWFGTRVHPEFARLMTASFVPQAVIALATFAALIIGLTRPRARRVLISLFVADLLFFNVMTDVGFATGSSSALPTRATSAAVLGTTGRYAIVDPGQSNFGVMETLGAPNLNVFSNLPSVQGYGSLVSNRYGAITGTHPMLALDACQLGQGTFRQLRLATLVISPTALAQVVPGALPFKWCRPIPIEATARRYFGTMHDVSEIFLSGWRHHSIASAPVTVQLINGTGQAVGALLTLRGRFHETVTLPTPIAAAGFIASAPGGVRLASSSIVATESGRAVRLRLNSPFQVPLASPAWRLVATTPFYSVFRATSVQPAQWLEGDAAGSAITHTSNQPWGDELITVRATRDVALVRSVAWLAGWRATATSVDSTNSRSLRVLRHGLIQGVAVPPGNWIIHFHYHAPYIELGLVVSIAALALFLLVVIVIVRPKVRRWISGNVT